MSAKNICAAYLISTRKLAEFSQFLLHHLFLGGLQRIKISNR